MKLQNFIIIFIIIIIPIILIFAYYLNLETKTIMIQTDYDEKLIEATKEAVEAFEINTTEWNGKYSSLANLKRQDLISSINVFTTSLANKIGIGGTSKENILTYIPAVVYTMYDGYYIYSPTYVPETFTDEKGVQLFYYENSGSNGTKITASATQNIEGEIVEGKPMYVCETGTAQSGTYNGQTITFTTQNSNAKKTYKHVLKTFVPYTTTYDENGKYYIINYTLDNYIRIYGEVQSKEGYVIEDFEGTNTIEVPVNSISGIKANGNIIEAEILTENIYVRDNLNQEATLNQYPYIYNSNNDKRYYDKDEQKFFMLNDYNVKVFLPDSYAGHTLAEYKKLLMRTEDTNWEYLELYQLLNGNNDNWYYKDSDGSYKKYEECQPDISKEQDCSAINYYVETWNFNKWLKENGINTEKILKNKKNAIIENINNNLNLSISNYNENSRMNYKIFELSDEDWEQALSNISMITFFQGVKAGLKTYNNYAIVTSTENNEYVTEDSLYYIGLNNDNYYHRCYCSDIINGVYQAYRNTDFKVQSYETEDNTKYYYKHKSTSGAEIYECFDCIVNRNNYQSENNYYDKTFYTALGRERYVQMSNINLIIDLNKTITVTFDKNGGECSTTSKQVTHNSTYGKLPGDATRVGRGFAGWYTAKKGGTQVISTTKVTKTIDHKLYARWTCEVTFNPNGGTLSKEKMQVVIGNGYGNLPGAAKLGYYFDGWYTSQGVLVTASTEVQDIGNHTLYARWTPAQYMVTFDPNGGACTTTNKQVTYDSTYGTLPTPTRTGYTFDGWFTETNGGTQVTSTTQVKIPANHTLYAHWTENTCIVTFDANGGNEVSPTSKTLAYNSQYGTMPTPTRTGYRFVGWYTAASGGTQVTSTTRIISNSDHTLYAHWTAYTYTITFNANGGSTTSPTSKTVTYNSQYGTLPSTTRTGYSFAGWYTAASGGTKVTATTQVTVASNHTLYAHWTKTYKITFNANGGSGSPSSQTKKHGENLVLSSLKPKRGGYYFAGWSTSSSATTATYKPGGTFTLNRDTTLYAVWQEIKVSLTDVDQWIPNNGKTINLVASITPNAVANNYTVSWSTSNSAVATVNNGKVTARGAGKTTITAKIKVDGITKSDSVDVYVYNAINNGNIEERHWAYSDYNIWEPIMWMYQKELVEHGTKLVLETVATSWHKIHYSSDSRLNGGYIWISADGTWKNTYTTYNFNWRK